MSYLEIDSFQQNVKVYIVENKPIHYIKTIKNNITWWTFGIIDILPIVKLLL